VLGDVCRARSWRQRAAAVVESPRRGVWSSRPRRAVVGQLTPATS
jgi:hypothetical protein